MQLQLQSMHLLNIFTLYCLDTTKKERRFRGMKLEWGIDKVIPLKAFMQAMDILLMTRVCLGLRSLFARKQAGAKESVYR
jgi:hypothetical protein